MIVDVIIPAFNEESSIALVLADIPKTLVRHVVVVNNNSSDQTAAVAVDNGAMLAEEKEKGYGAACLKGIEKIKSFYPLADVIVFIDADYSDHPEEIPLLLAPIQANEADFVLGSRALGKRDKGSMMSQQIFGNMLAVFLLKKIYSSKFTDLGPMRAIRTSTLLELGMKDRNFGWTVEMQVKVLRMGIPYMEIPVSYRKRVGVSKITGTIKGSLMAGYKIISTILKYARS